MFPSKNRARIADVKIVSPLSVWRFVGNFWPLLLFFALAQLFMRWTGNTAYAGVPWWLSAFDAAVFLGAFGTAAFWAFKPLLPAARWLQKNSLTARRYLERAMQRLSGRALKAFALAGLICSIYLFVVISAAAAWHNVEMSGRMIAALVLCVFYGIGVLAPALGLVMTWRFMVHARKRLARQGVFISGLEVDATLQSYSSPGQRPWMLFGVTSLFPASILAFYVYLILEAGSPDEQRFILLQASVLFMGLVGAGTYLVHTVSRIVMHVTAELASGLDYLRHGHFDGRVAVLMEDEFGGLARGLNTALAGLAEREELKHSLEIASEIHRGLLPQHLPHLPGYGIHGFQRSCQEVGGDYYDCIPLPDGGWQLVVADVAGKGYPAAITVANLRAMLHAMAHLQIPFGKAAAYINDTLCETLTGGRFVTMFMARLQPEKHELQWLNTGHVPPLLASAGRFELLEALAPPMGLQSDLEFEVVTRTLLPGDTLFAYTDGVTEACDRSGKEMFGDTRLQRWFEQHYDAPLAELPERLNEELELFGSVVCEDDLTLLCLRREEY